MQPGYDPELTTVTTIPVIVGRKLWILRSGSQQIDPFAVPNYFLSATR